MNLIGNAVRVLVEDEAVRARVLEEPEIVPRLLEETLRWNSPVQRPVRSRPPATDSDCEPVSRVACSR
jgi:cytochrome P450